MRGTSSSNACFNFALAGIHQSPGLFQILCRVGIYELKRTGLRASFQPKHILHMVEKFAASDIQGQYALELYNIAGIYLEKKKYNDTKLIENLKEGRFAFHFTRPLIWLWRFSSRQKKISPAEYAQRSHDNVTVRSIKWSEFFKNTSKPLVVDIGSGMGASLLNLSTMARKDSKTGELNMDWPDCNFAGADLNQSFVNFGNGIISRDTTSQRRGRVHFFSLSAEDFLESIHTYPGRLALVMINFPSPYRLEVTEVGNSQLPSKYSNQFTVTEKVLVLVDRLLSRSNHEGMNGIFLFQTKCEDMAVYVKNECLSLTSMESVSCKYSVKDVELEYSNSGKRQKRVDEWLRTSPAERAEGTMYSSRPLLPNTCLPETEVQCIYDKTIVHRLIFRSNK